MRAHDLKRCAEEAEARGDYDEASRLYGDASRAYADRATLLSKVSMALALFTLLTVVLKVIVSG